MDVLKIIRNLRYLKIFMKTLLVEKSFRHKLKFSVENLINVDESSEEGNQNQENNELSDSEQNEEDTGVPVRFRPLEQATEMLRIEIRDGQQEMSHI